jgi:hypothetical protein
VKFVNYDAPHYAFYVNLLLISVSWVYIFCSALYTQTPSISFLLCVLLLLIFKARDFNSVVLHPGVFGVIKFVFVLKYCHLLQCPFLYTFNSSYIFSFLYEIT